MYKRKDEEETGRKQERELQVVAENSAQPYEVGLATKLSTLSSRPRKIMTNFRDNYSSPAVITLRKSLPFVPHFRARKQLKAAMQKLMGGVKTIKTRRFIYRQTDQELPMNRDIYGLTRIYDLVRTSRAWLSFRRAKALTI